MERTATLNDRFRTLLAALVAAAMVALMLAGLAAPARATTGPSATLTFSLGGIDETITFEDGTRSARIEGASGPLLAYGLRASIGDLVLESGTDAGVELASVTFDPFGPVGPSDVACTDIWRTPVDDVPCPLQPWLGASRPSFAPIDSAAVTVATEAGDYTTVIRLFQDSGNVTIGELEIVITVFPVVAAGTAVNGVDSLLITEGVLSSTVQRGSSVTVETYAWSDFGTDVVTLSASRPGGALVDDAAAEALCDELFEGTCPFDPILGVLGTDGIVPKIEDESGTIAADAQYGSWTFTLELWEIFDDGTDDDCPEARVDESCRLSFVTVVLDVERPAEAARSGMILDDGGVPPSVAPGDVRYRMLGEAPVALPTTRVSSPTGVSAVGGDVGIVVVGDRSSSAVGPVADARGGLTVTLNGPIPEGAVVEVWMASEPRLVAAGRSDGSGTLAIVVPVAAPLDGQGAVAPGAHTLQAQVPLASGVAVFDVGVTVGGPVPTGVPSGLAPSSSGVWAVSMGMLAVATILIGLASVGTTRHRRRLPVMSD